MVDRVSSSISIGGVLPRAHLAEFVNLIADENLSLDWDGEAFHLSQLVSGQTLSLMAYGVAQGQFNRLEDFCVARSLPFRRWSGGCFSWGPQRAVFDGEGDVNYLAADEHDCVLLCRETAAELGSIEAILAWFDHADRGVPALVIS